jgi:hypothetical protein
VQNYIEFTRSQKVEFAQESLGMNALGRAGIELGECDDVDISAVTGDRTHGTLTSCFQL